VLAVIPDIPTILPVLLVILLIELYYHTGHHIQSESDTFEDLQTEPGRYVKNRIITHTDFDGFTSGALLLRFLGKDTSIFFSSPGPLLKNLKSLGDGLIGGDNIYIADLAMQPHQEHEFADLLNGLRNKNVNVIWIDHHEWPAGLIERMSSICRELEVKTSVKTAAALIRNRLADDDEHAERLLRFVQNRSDDADKEWDRIWRYALAELVHRRDPELSENLLRIWAENEKAGVLRAYLAREGYKREKTTLSIASHQHRRVKTAHGKSFLVIDVRSNRLECDRYGRSLFVVNGAQPSVMVGKQACTDQNGDFCLIIWNDFRFSIYKGLDPDIDFSNLFGQRDIDGLLCRISGHKYAVSVSIIPGLKQRLKTMFRFRLGPEVEQIIEILQKTY